MIKFTIKVENIKVVGRTAIDFINERLVADLVETPNTLKVLNVTAEGDATVFEVETNFHNPITVAEYFIKFINRRKRFIIAKNEEEAVASNDCESESLDIIEDETLKTDKGDIMKEDTASILPFKEVKEILTVSKYTNIKQVDNIIYSATNPYNEQREFIQLVENPLKVVIVSRRNLLEAMQKHQHIQQFELEFLDDVVAGRKVYVRDFVIEKSVKSLFDKDFKDISEENYFYK